MADSMVTFFANEDLYKVYVSVIDTKARVLNLTRQIALSEYAEVLIEEAKRLDEIKGKLEELIWSA